MEKPNLWGLLQAGIEDVSFIDDRALDTMLWDFEEGDYSSAIKKLPDIFDMSVDDEASSLLEYINQFDMNNPEVKDILTKYARLISSNQTTAVMGEPTPSAIGNILFNNLGPYYGQSLDVLRSNMTDKEIDFYYENLDVESAPNLRDIFFGMNSPEQEGLQETNLRPSKGYPFRGDKVYDLEPYVELRNIFHPDISGPEDLSIEKQIERNEKGRSLYKRAMDLKPNEGFRIEEPLYYTSIDLGNTNWSIGKDEDGNIYAAIADVWDFGGGALEGYGNIMDMVGGNPINLYGRIYLDETDFMNMIGP